MKATKKIVSIICVMMIALSTLALTGCGKESNSIVGEWVYGGSTEYVYKFNSDGTGSYGAYGIEMKFTYEDDGENVSILYDGNTMASKYAYKIEGKKLIIKDSLGNDVEYNRRK